MGKRRLSLWIELLRTTAGSIRFPYRNYRPDGAGVDYPSSPIRRYEALAMPLRGFSNSANSVRVPTR